MSTKQWVISSMDCKPKDGDYTDVVITCHWRRQATEVVGEKTYTADMYGACTITLPEPESFIEFDSLTEEAIVGWLEDTLDVAAIDSALDAQIETQKNPPIVTKKAPWIVEETPAPIAE